MTPDRPRQLMSRGDIKLRARVVDVTFDGTNRQRQFFSDLPIRQAVGDQFNRGVRHNSDCHRG